MNDDRLGAITLEVFKQIIDILILAIGNALIILGEGCITYVKESGANFENANKRFTPNT